MVSYQEINEFLKTFNTNSYNRTQIGNSKQIIISVFEFLNKLNISKESIDLIVSNIAYLNKDTTNIALYLELLSKSLGFASSYDLKEVVRMVKQIHDIYYKSSALIPLEEYIHDIPEERVRKLFLNRNSKYLIKNFESPESLTYINDLKFASAIALDKKDYREFLSYIDEFEKFQDNYSPLILFKTYNKVRTSLKDETKLFWDIIFGNEYVVALTKHNMPIKDLFKRNIFSSYKNKKQVMAQMPLQLDLFSMDEEGDEPIYITEEVNAFQISTIYNSNELPEFNEEEDLILYYKDLLKGREAITLPKLKNNKVTSYRYNLN